MASKSLGFSAPVLRRGDSGFALPISIGVGLFLIIVAASIILRSQQQQVTAIAQKQTASSLSAAEVGVSRIQNLLTNYRAASLYPACANLTGNTCDAGTSSSQTWANAGDIPGLPESCPKDEPATSTDPIDKVKAAATRAWQEIDPSNPTKGKYRLVDYSYSTPGKPDGEGTLKVQGRAGAASGVSSAVTQLSVTIPVRAISEYVPGLWVKGLRVEDLVDTDTIKTNILGPCEKNKTIKAPSDTTYSVTRSAVLMPDVPFLPSEVKDLGPSIPEDTVLPLTEDIKGEPDTYTYQYVVKNIDTSFKVTPGKKVELWVRENIKLQDGQKIQHQCGDQKKKGVAVCSPFDAKIYGLASSGTIELNGDAAVCDVFFHAPTYNVVHPIEKKDSGRVEGCGNGHNNDGIYWVNSWSGGGGERDTQFALEQTDAKWPDQPKPKLLLPLTALKSITSWQREAAEAEFP